MRLVPLRTTKKEDRIILAKRKKLPRGRIASALELYKQQEVSLDKAVEMTDMGVVEFKERLTELGNAR